MQLTYFFRQGPASSFVRVLRAAMTDVIMISIGMSVAQVYGQAPPLPTAFTRVTVSDGLIHGRASAVAVDSFGFLWAGTFEGLSVFDRPEPRNYSLADVTAGRCGNAVTALTRTRDGMMYVASFGCVSAYDYGTQTFTPLSFGASRTPTAFGVTGLVPSRVTDGLWVATDAYGLLFGGAAEPLRRAKLAPDAIYALANGAQNDPNELYLATERGLVRACTERSGELSSAETVAGGVRRITTLLAGEPLLVGTDGEGVWQYDRHTARLTRLPQVPGDLIVRALSRDAEGRVWIGTDGAGLFVLQGERTAHLMPDARQPGSLLSSTIYDITHGPTGLTYLALYGGGVARYDPAALPLAPLSTLLPTAGPSTDASVRSVLVDPDGATWLGTRNGLVGYRQPAAQPVAFPYRNGDPRGPSAPIILSLARDPGGALYLGTFGGGLNRYRPRAGGDGGVFERIVLPANTPGSENIYSITVLAEDLLVGTQAELYRFTPERGSFELVPMANFVRKAIALPDGRAFLATERGLLLYDGARSGAGRTTKLWPREGTRPVFDVLWASAKTVYLAVEDRGLVKLELDLGPSVRTGSDIAAGASSDIASGSVIRASGPKVTSVGSYGPEAGLPGKSAVSLVRDATGELWVGTYRGIAHFSAAAGRFTAYDPSYEGEASEYYPGAAALAPGGELLFGRLGGVDRFLPPVGSAALARSPSLYFTEARVTLGDSVRSARGYWGQSLVTLDTATLGPEVDRLSVQLMPDAAASVEPVLEHRLLGLEQVWHRADANGVASYSRIPPGDYVLEARALGPAGALLASRRLHLRVLAPVWQRWYARVMYALLTLGAAYAFRRSRARRRRLRRLTQEREFQREQRAEQDRQRLAFFTNVSHELRTPLTLIYSPIQKLLRGQEDGRGGGLDAAQRGILAMAGRNVERLRALVDQLLDLRRLESGAMPLQPVPGDVVTFAGEIVSDFEVLAREREIGLVFVDEVPPAHRYCRFDADALAKMLYNLLDNAIKFTPPAGRVELRLARLSCGSYRVTCADTGCGIPAEELGHVFDRFYVHQHKSNPRVQGTGIGLALVRALAEAQGGSATAESQVGAGTTLYITLPLELAPRPAGLPKVGRTAWHATPDSFAPRVLAEADTPERGGGGPIGIGRADALPSTNSRPGLPRVLVVEDNPDILAYLVHELSDHFSVATASNGREGLDAALAHPPAIVLSDVLMPEMDGLTLTRALRARP